MKYNSNNKPIECLMKNSTNYKNGDYAKPVGVLVHSTGANNPRISRYVQPSTNDPKYNELISLIGKNSNRNDWNTAVVWAGVNAWIGELANGTIASVQSLPWTMSPWGCADGYRGSCNLYNGMHWIQFEICESDLNDKAYFEATYKEACELTAYLCKLYNIDPNGSVNCGGANVPTVLCHRDSYDYGMGSCHADIYHWWNRYGKDMDDFRKDVAALMKNSSTPTATVKPNTSTTTTAPSSQIYRIRKTWADAKSQKGAYTNLKSAKEHCAKCPGYSVFDEKGKAVYTAPKASTSTSTTTSKSKAGDVKYQVYAKGKWWSYITNYGSGDNGYAGVVGYPMMALRAYVKGEAKEVGYLEYRVHKVGGSWYPWQRDEEKDKNGDNFAGDLKNKFDGLQMRIVGVKGRHVKYRVHVIGKGWLDWITDYGDGSDGYAGWYGYAIDGVQVDII